MAGSLPPRRLLDFEAHRDTIAASQATIGRPVDFSSWTAHARQSTSRVYLDDKIAQPAKLLHFDLWQRGRVQIIFWTPMKITLLSDFLLTLPVLALGIAELVMDFGPEAQQWDIWGHAPRNICEAWAGYFGPIVTVEAGNANPDYPSVGGTFRARSTVGQIEARIPELLL